MPEGRSDDAGPRGEVQRETPDVGRSEEHVLWRRPAAGGVCPAPPLSSNRTANSDSEPGRAELPPSTIPMRVVSLRADLVTVW